MYTRNTIGIFYLVCVPYFFLCKYTNRQENTFLPLVLVQVIDGESYLNSNKQCDNDAVIKAVISRINFICDFTLLIIGNNIYIYIYVYSG